MRHGIRKFSDPSRLAFFALSLSRAPGVGAKGFRLLIDLLQTPQLAFEWYLKKFKRCGHLLPRCSREKEPLSGRVKHVIESESMTGDLLVYGQKGYPPLLADLTEPPPVLFKSGRLPERPMAAIVGSRCPENPALEITGEAVEGLGRVGFSIVSGGAKGVDTAAHRAALGVGTVAVLGSGVDVPYPAENSCLFGEIEKNGALLSELLPGTPPRRDFFPTRNRIIAGLASCTIVIQAGPESGSLITARQAMRIGRPVLVFQPPVRTPAWSGNEILLRRGALPFDSVQALVGSCLETTRKL